MVHQFDKGRIEDIKEDIDTLLVFVSPAYYLQNYRTNKLQAGLFSAVITTFIVDSYKDLQQQPEDLTYQALLQVSKQLSGLSANGNLANITSTIDAFSPPSFSASFPTIFVNTLWSLSLVIALITASLGILVKQWFHELLSYDTHDPKERLKLRFFREEGLERWKVLAIASSLPLLLQLALMLFFIGLGVSLHHLNPIVAWITTTAMISWLSFFLFTVTVPMISPQCPYKVPMLKTLLGCIRVRNIPRLYSLAHQMWLYTSGPMFDKLFRNIQDWLESQEKLEENIVCKNGALSLPAILCARDVLRGERLNEPMVECTADITLNEMSRTLKRIRDADTPVDLRILPDVTHGLGNAVDAFALDMLKDHHSRTVYFGGDLDPSSFLMMYSSLVGSHVKSYTLRTELRDSVSPIPSQSLDAFTILILTNTNSAAFSLLTMYAIRHRTMVDCPNDFYRLFQRPTHTVMHSHTIGKISRFLRSEQC